MRKIQLAYLLVHRPTIFRILWQSVNLNRVVGSN